MYLDLGFVICPFYLSTPGTLSINVFYLINSEFISSISKYFLLFIFIFLSFNSNYLKC